jgi:hypothetical protein
MHINWLTNSWLKECVQLTIHNGNQVEDLTSLVTDGSLVRFLFFIQNFKFPIVLFLIPDTGPEFC